MPLLDVGTTDSSNLRALRDWRNYPAWSKFQKRYEPLLRSCCSRLRLDHDAADEICQQTWIEVANRMESFVYDPKGSFRGWLWTVCHHEAIDFLKGRMSAQAFSIDERDETIAADLEPVDRSNFANEAGTGGLSEDEGTSPTLAALFREAEEIQVAVRQRVAAHTWEAFWLVGVVLWTVEETAKYLRMTRANVYKAKARVTEMLRDEGSRRAVMAIDRGSADQRPG